MMWSVDEGDCRKVMGAMEADSVDAIVTDPPYGLAFMGKAWDHGVPGVEFWAAALRVAKPGAYMLAFGGTRTYHRLTCAIEDAGWEVHDCLTWLYGSGFPKHRSKLKPAWEPIVLARKPAKRATLLNVEACRIEYASGADKAGAAFHGRSAEASMRGNFGQLRTGLAVSETENHRSGRWPANVVLDEEAAAALDAHSGAIKTKRIEKPSACRTDGAVFNGESFQGNRPARGYTDDGGASRFFYVAKASRRERDAGLGRLPNHHPTVKPIALMRWLVRLVTPDDGLVFDPFAGSGTTGCAAVLEGRRFIGAELDAGYAAIARARIAHWNEQARQTP